MFSAVCLISLVNHTTSRDLIWGDDLSRPLTRIFMTAADVCLLTIRLVWCQHNYIGGTKIEHRPLCRYVSAVVE